MFFDFGEPLLQGFEAGFGFATGGFGFPECGDCGLESICSMGELRDESIWIRFEIFPSRCLLVEEGGHGCEERCDFRVEFVLAGAVLFVVFFEERDFVVQGCEFVPLCLAIGLLLLRLGPEFGDLFSNFFEVCEFSTQRLDGGGVERFSFGECGEGMGGGEEWGEFVGDLLTVCLQGLELGFLAFEGTIELLLLFEERGGFCFGFGQLVFEGIAGLLGGGDGGPEGFEEV